MNYKINFSKYNVLMYFENIYIKTKGYISEGGLMCERNQIYL